MKHSNGLWRYGITFSICCLVVIVSTHQNCPPPDAPVGGKYTPKRNKFLPGDKVNYTCKYDFLFVGTSIRTCKDGAWSNSTPFCDRKMKMYDLPGDKLNSSHSDSPMMDGDIETCSSSGMCPGCAHHLYFDKIVLRIIRIFLSLNGTGRITIETGLNNQTKKNVVYDGDIETGQWMEIECRNNSCLADTISIMNRAEIAFSICEIQVFGLDEHSCKHPPEISVPNGHFEVSRREATLICKVGYRRRNSKMVCEGNLWKSPGFSCDKPKLLNSIIAGVGGAVLGISILIFLGVVIYVIRKQKNREAVFKSTDSSTASGSESKCGIPNYGSKQLTSTL